MEALGYLGVAPTRSTSPLWPKVYYLTQRGARRLRQALAAKGKPGHVIRLDRWKARGYTADHVLHEILITEFLLAVWQTVEARADLDLLRIERRSLATHSAFRIGVGGRLTRLIPDAMFVHRQQGQGMMCSFVELDTGSESLRQIHVKYRRYEAWAVSSVGRDFLTNLYRRCGAKNPRPVFRLLMVASDNLGASDDKRMADLLDTAEKFPVVRRSGWFTTASNLNQFQSNAQPLVGPVWQSADGTRAMSAKTGGKRAQGRCHETPYRSLFG